jgi:hypothetical protein
MQFNNYLNRKMPFVVLLGLLFGLASCGSYQYVGADTDGIYGDAPAPANTEAVVKVENESNSDYYKNYFKTKAIESESIYAGDEIFTDIDAYESPNYVENDTLSNDYQGYAGWGQNSNNITINYIDNGWNNWGWYGSYYGWNRGFYSGWNTWGYYDPFWCPPYYGGFYGGLIVNNYWGYNSVFYRPRFYNYGYYNTRGYRNNLSFSNSRRGSYYASNTRNSTNNTSRRSSATTQSRTTSKYNISRRGSVNTNSNSATTTTRRTYNPNGTRSTSGVVRRSTVARTPSSNSTARASSSTSTRRSSQPNVSRRSSSSNRSYSPSSSSSRSRSSSSSASRSSSSSRSSGSSSRSSSSGRRR